MHPVAVQAVLLDLPGLLFFSTYTLLVLFWAEIYHQARNLSTASLRPAFLAFNAAVYIVQVPACLVKCGSAAPSRICHVRLLMSATCTPGMNETTRAGNVQLCPSAQLISVSVNIRTRLECDCCRFMRLIAQRNSCHTSHAFTHLRHCALSA